VIGSDIFATLCDVVRIGPPAGRVIDGASMLPLLEGKPIARSEPLYWRNHLAPEAQRIALREGRWKIVGSEDRKRFELYDLQRDPAESVDVSAEFVSEFDELKSRLIEQDEEVLAEGPIWWRDEP
jgi:arylsulfatase A-like enzyme